VADAEREAIWQAERQEQTARDIAQALCTWMLRSGTAPVVVRKVLVEQAQVLIDAAKAPDDPDRSAKEVMARKRRHSAAASTRVRVVRA
jgi:hypothetical protein